MSLVVAVRSPLTSLLQHNQPFSVQVPALVAKSRGLGAMMRDTQTAGAGNVDAQWSGTTGAAYPNDYTGAQLGQNMQIRAPGYDPFSQSIGTPNPFVSGIYAAINNNTGGVKNEFEQWLQWKFQLPATIQSGDTCCLYMRWRERNDPSANLGVSAGHGSGYNNKIFAYGPGAYSSTFTGNNPPQSWLTALPNSGNSAALQSITWSSANGGTATATTVANIPDQATNLTFCSLVQGASPAGFNIGSSSQLAPNFTITGPNTFTYPLANPGSSSATTPGTYLTPAWTNLTTGCQLHNGDNTNGSPVILEVPDRNGKNSIFWNPRLNSYNASNGWLQVEVEMCIDTHTGSSGKGYYRYIVNGNRAASGPTGVIINYAGRTDNFMVASATQRAIDFGCGMYSQAVGANSIAYLSDIYCDMSAGGVSGQCARLLAGDSATYNSCVVLEPQNIANMTQAGGQTTIGGTFWKGSLQSGSTVYWYYQDESGTVYPSGSQVVI